MANPLNGGRKPNVPIEGNYESVINELNKFIKQLDTVRSKAIKELNEVKYNTHDNADRIQLESVRSNAFKSLEHFFKLRLDALKLHALIADKLTPKQNAEISGKINKEDKDHAYEYLEKMREELRNSKKK